ncbi:hypothetical protein ECB41_A0032 [Escherichia coli B41]|nr:hypothetical protein ECB41_A0032 [Escherichia coli B41]
MASWILTPRPRRRKPRWVVTDETMRNWLKQAEANGVQFPDS